MPTYDYECDACGHEFELFQSISEPVKRKCPECKKSKLRRLFGTGAAVVFKGSGFYETDYRSESYKKGAEQAKQATEKSKSADGKGDKGSKGGKSDKSNQQPSKSETAKKKRSDSSD
ncbi:MAG: FmdB family zinc ribbon protein [Bythopirellula sp.]